MKLLGKWGETLAAELLRKKGFKIVGMGYHSRFGEIDVIAEDKRYIVFCEVKLRKNANFAQGREFVDRRKQDKIISTARIWLSSSGCEKQPRFDVVEIYASDGLSTNKPEMIHIEDAFGEDY